ncbi:MAG: DUF4026 domain-containing protein [Bacilli bacterium]|nr:DUF4026 domain-containing protein [Bacilli bacterium]
MKKIVEQPLYYWEEKSYMLFIPKNENCDFFTKAIERIKEIPEVKVIEQHVDAIKQIIYITLEYKEEEYEVGLYSGGVNVPEYYLDKSFLFKEDEKKEILSAKYALTIFMKFGENAKESFQLQLKLGFAIVSDVIGILDESAERVFPVKWAYMVANSKVLPSSNSLFTVQAVMGDKNNVWLHTHGLCRCGLPELEILESNVSSYQNHYNLISTYAMYLLDRNEKEDPNKSSAYIGCLINGCPVVVTCKPWTEGLFEYKKLKLGGLKDRENGHNSKTSIVFLYQCEEDEKNDVLSKVSIYDNLWGENPLFFFSDAETARMKELAMERFHYVKEQFQNKENTILIKIGLPLKEKGKFEHIWFELIEMKDDKFKAKLTQEPYDVPNIHEGDEAWFTVDDVTSWTIYTKNIAIDPNLVYLLEE